MHITVVNDKGGVAKTTTAIHLAAFFQRLGPTMLIDKDQHTTSALAWGEDGKLPFKVFNFAEGVYHARNYEHVIIDTKGGEDKTDLEGLAKGSDFLVVPTSPHDIDTKSMIQTLNPLMGVKDKFKVLIVKARPRSVKALKLRENLQEFSVPHFTAEIPLLEVFDMAFGEGVPVCDVRHEYAQQAWEAYQSVGEEILNGQKR
jgi:chromosome partitioning protein